MQSNSNHPDTAPAKRKARRRTYGHCGICGSGNVAWQGVVWCEDCGAEVEAVDLDITPFFRFEALPHPCQCVGRVWTFRGAIRSRKRLGRRGVAKCLDCGAVRNAVCANGEHACWHHWDGRMWCTKCGFQRGRRPYVKP